MTWSDLTVCAPFAAVVGLAALVILIDIAWPGRRAPVLAVSLAGLAAIAVLTWVVGQTPGTPSR